MKKKVLSILLAVVMIVGMIPLGMVTASAAAATLTGFAGGDGTADSPYQIGTKAQLEHLAEIVNGGTDCTDTYFELTDNIGSTQAPVTTVIGGKDSAYESVPFNGHFDGKGYTVTLSIAKSPDEIKSELSDLGVTIGEPEFSMILSVPAMAGMFLGNLPAGVTMEQVVAICSQGPKDYAGLFGWLGEDGEIKNVTTAGSVNGTGDVGGVCGYSAGTLTGCYNTGTVNGQANYVGGVCGNNGGTVTNCYNTGSVNGTGEVGGVCGAVDGGSLTNCYNVGSVNGTGDIGGVCGYSTGTLTNCYNAGSVNGTRDVGGVCGWNRATVTSCYYNSTVYSGNVCGSGEGTASYGLPTEQMQAATGSTLSTGVANNKPLVVLLNEYVTAHSSDNLRPWTNKQGEYPVFGTPHTHVDENKDFVCDECGYENRAGAEAAGFKYENESDDTILTGYTGDGTEIVIPGWTTVIGNWAFFENNFITKVTITASVEKIGEGLNVFSSSPNLESVIFEEGSKLKTIGDFAFGYCESLAEINLEDCKELEIIGMCAFEFTKLTSITIPASVNTIGTSAFQEDYEGCGILESVIFEEGSKLKTIGSSAFQFCRSLAEINLDACKELETIGDCAFNICESLTEIDLDACQKLVTIDSCAFYDTGLTSIHIPASVKEIGSEAFSTPEPLTDLYLNWTNEDDIVWFDFNGEDGTTTVHIPAGTRSIYIGTCFEWYLPSPVVTLVNATCGGQNTFTYNAYDGGEYSLEPADIDGKEFKEFVLDGDYEGVEITDCTLYINDEVNADITVTAVYDTLVAVPEVIDPITYDGVEHTPYEGTDAYTVSGDVTGKDVGEYTVTFELKDGYVWADEDFDGTITWKIAAPAAHEHTFATEYSYNETDHWQAATCEHTEFTKNLGEHTFNENGKCTVCGYEDTGIRAKICTVILTSITEPDTVLYSGTTDGKNICNIGNVANGTYLMSVSCEGAVTRTYTTEVENGKVTQEVALYAEGDVNGDGVVDVNDYSAAVNSALGTETEVAKDLTKTADYQKAVADLDKDGVVDVLDVVLLERKIHI